MSTTNTYLSNALGATSDLRSAEVPTIPMPLRTFTNPKGLDADTAAFIDKLVSAHPTSLAVKASQAERRRIPSKPEFYLIHFFTHIVPGYLKGWNTYFSNLFENPVKGLFFVGVTLGTGTLLTMLPNQKQAIKTLMLAALGPFAISNFAKNMPRIPESYELMKQGKPEAAEKEFNKGLDEVLYSFAQILFKPMLFSTLVYTGLNFPKIARNTLPVKGWRVIFKLLNEEHWVGRIMDRFVLKHKHRSPSIQKLDRGLTKMDNAITNPLLRKGEDLLSWIEKLPLGKKLVEKTQDTEFVRTLPTEIWSKIRGGQAGQPPRA